MPDEDAPPPDPDSASTADQGSPPEDEPDAPSDEDDLPGPLGTSVGALWALLGPPDDKGPDDTDDPSPDKG